MARVQLEHVYKTFGGNVDAVTDFNLDIQDEEFVVFVGPSGCGKTTTLRMVAGLESVSRGDIFIGEGRVTEDAPKDRDIAMVFQNYALYPHMTVYQNMAFGLQLRKMAKSDVQARVRHAAQILDIEHLLQRRPKELSGGQRQRVALGRAIVREPKAFLMDEPLSNLDAKLRVQMRAEIRKLHQQVHTTTIYVTHDQIEAMTMGDRIVIMNNGTIQQCDTPQTVYNHPVNLFVAGFIGSPSMNFVHGNLTRESGTLYFMADGFKVPIPDSLAPADGTAREVVLGFRPEHLDVYDETQKDAVATIRCSVDVVEHMGSEVYLDVTCSKTPVVARVSPRHVYEPGNMVDLALDVHQVHLFDAESGLNLNPAVQQDADPANL